MVIWEARLRNLTGLSFKDLQSQPIAELLTRIPSPMRADPDLKAFLWKLSIYLGLNRLRQTQAHAQEQELLELWEKLKDRYNPPPEFLRRKGV